MQSGVYATMHAVVIYIYMLSIEKVKHHVFLKRYFPSINSQGGEKLNLIFVIIVKSNFLVTKPFGKGETKTN